MQQYTDNANRMNFCNLVLQNVAHGVVDPKKKMKYDMIIKNDGV